MDPINYQFIPLILPTCSGFILPFTLLVTSITIYIKTKFVTVSSSQTILRFYLITNFIPFLLELAAIIIIILEFSNISSFYNGCFISITTLLYHIFVLLFLIEAGFSFRKLFKLSFEWDNNPQEN